MKIIGVTPRVLIEDGVQKQFVNTRYLNQLTKRNFNAIMLTMNNPKLEEVLKLCDGFLITGGYDIDPEYYHEENSGKSKNCIPELDEVDRLVVTYAKAHQIPILGVCRGIQAINVFLGGDLNQDIGNGHRSIDSDHAVQTVKNHLLHFEDEIQVNSYHHQTLKNLAPGLKIVATHTDGTIEAVIHETLPIIGIQWHPEILADEKESKIIFDKFAELVNKK